MCVCVQLKTVLIKHMFKQIPWSSLRTKPIVFYLGKIDIELSEPSKLREVPKKKEQPTM